MKRIFLIILIMILLSSCSGKTDFTSATDVTKSFYELLYNPDSGIDFCSDYMYLGNEVLCESVVENNSNIEDLNLFSVESVSLDESYEGFKENQVNVSVTLCYKNGYGCIYYSYGTILSENDGVWSIEAFKVNLDNLS